MTWFEKYSKYKKKYIFLIRQNKIGGGNQEINTGIIDEKNRNIQSGGNMPKSICAPGVKYDNINKTCMCINDYKELAKKKSVKNVEYMDFSELIKKLEKVYESTKCGKEDQSCWFDTDHVSASVKKLKHLHKERQFEWLNSRDIDKAMIQYENKYKNFKFLGTHPMDFQDIYKEFKYFKLADYIQKYDKLGMILNLDKSHQPGSHWVGYFIDVNKKELSYFDSFAQVHRPTPPEVINFTNKIINENKYNSKFTFKENNYKYQSANTECGMFSILWILEKIKGLELPRFASDNIVNKTRNKDTIIAPQIFRNPSRAGRTNALEEYWPKS